MSFREVNGNSEKERWNSSGVCGMYDYKFVKYAERLMEIHNHSYMGAEMQD